MQEFYSILFYDWQSGLRKFLENFRIVHAYVGDTITFRRIRPLLYYDAYFIGVEPVSIFRISPSSF